MPNKQRTKFHPSSNFSETYTSSTPKFNVQWNATGTYSNNQRKYNQLYIKHSIATNRQTFKTSHNIITHCWTNTSSISFVWSVCCHSLPIVERKISWLEMGVDDQIWYIVDPQNIFSKILFEHHLRISTYLLFLDGRNPASPAADKKRRQRLKIRSLVRY